MPMALEEVYSVMSVVSNVATSERIIVQQGVYDFIGVTPPADLRWG